MISKRNIVLLFLFIMTSAYSDTLRLKEYLAEIDKITNGNPKQAIEIAKEAEKTFDETDSPGWKACILNRIGNAYTRLGEIDNALLYLDKALKAIPDENRNLNTRGDIFNTYGILYSRTGDLKKAIESLLKSIAYFEKMKSMDHRWDLKQNLAICYAQSGNTSKAMEYLMEVKQLLAKQKDFSNLAQTCTNMGVVFEMENKLDSSLHYYEDAYAILSKNGNTPGLAMLLNNMGSAAVRLKKYKEAGDYIQKSMKMMAETGDQKGAIMVMNNFAEMLYEGNKLDEALKYGTEAYNASANNKLFNELKLSADILSKIYFKMNDSRNAYLFCRMYANLNDSLINTESVKQIAEMEARYETTNKQKEIAILKKDNQIQQIQNSKNKSIIIFLTAGALVFVGLFLLILRQYKEKKRINDQLEFKNKLIEEKQKEILDSIKYARRIQTALITNEKYIAKTIGNLNTSKK